MSFEYQIDHETTMQLEARGKTEMGYPALDSDTSDDDTQYAAWDTKAVEQAIYEQWEMTCQYYCMPTTKIIVQLKALEHHNDATGGSIVTLWGVHLEINRRQHNTFDERHMSALRWLVFESTRWLETVDVEMVHCEWHITFVHAELDDYAIMGKEAYEALAELKRHGHLVDHASTPQLLDICTQLVWVAPLFDLLLHANVTRLSVVNNFLGDEGFAALRMLLADERCSLRALCVTQSQSVTSVGLCQLALGVAASQHLDTLQVGTTECGALMYDAMSVVATTALLDACLKRNLMGHTWNKLEINHSVVASHMILSDLAVRELILRNCMVVEVKSKPRRKCDAADNTLLEVRSVVIDGCCVETVPLVELVRALINSPVSKFSMNHLQRIDDNGMVAAGIEDSEAFTDAICDLIESMRSFFPN